MDLEIVLRLKLVSSPCEWFAAMVIAAIIDPRPFFWRFIISSGQFEVPLRFFVPKCTYSHFTGIPSKVTRVHCSVAVNIVTLFTVIAVCPLCNWSKFFWGSKGWSSSEARFSTLTGLEIIYPTIQEEMAYKAVSLVFGTRFRERMHGLSVLELFVSRKMREEMPWFREYRVGWHSQWSCNKRKLSKSTYNRLVQFQAIHISGLFIYRRDNLTMTNRLEHTKYSLNWSVQNARNLTWFRCRIARLSATLCHLYHHLKFRQKGKISTTWLILFPVHETTPSCRLQYWVSIHLAAAHSRLQSNQWTVLG